MIRQISLSLLLTMGFETARINHILIFSYNFGDMVQKFLPATINCLSTSENVSGTPSFVIERIVSDLMLIRC